jgi:ribosomal protein L35AE/L33A
MIKVSLKRSYRSQNGNTVFVYAVNAKPEEVEAYKLASGDYYREQEDGTPLWFTTRCIGNSGTLVITSKGKIVPDMSAFEQAASLAKQFGGNFGDALAKASVANLLGGNTTEENPEA